MKKIWQNNSYTILLIATSLILTLIVASGLNLEDDDKYTKITVQSGESLWEMAEDYSKDHNLTKTEFIAWVEKKNGISDGKIYVGDELILPVSPTTSMSAQYAGIDVE